MTGLWAGTRFMLRGLRACFVIGSVLGLAACSSDGQRFLELPTPAGAETLWLSLERGGDFEDAVFPLEPAPAIEERIEPGDRMFLSYLAESLEELGLGEGPIEPAAEGACHAKAPPAALITYQWSEDELEVFEGDILVARKFAYELPCPCRTLALELVQFPFDADLAQILPIGPDRAELLVSARNSATASLLLYDHATGTLELSLDGLTVAKACANGQPPIYVAGRGSEFSRYDELSGLAAAPARPVETNAFEMACAPPPADPEVYVLDDLGHVQRFDGATWSTVYDSDPVPHPLGSNQASIVWLGPEQIVFIQNDGAEIIYSDGPATLNVPWGPDQTFGSSRGGSSQLLDTEQFGLLMRTRTNNILVDAERSGVWTELEIPTPEEARHFHGMAEISNGLLFSSEYADIWEYNHTLRDYCPPWPIEAGLDLDKLTRINDRLFLAGGQRADPNDPGWLVVIEVQ